jgi:hypothetical protein
MNGPRFVYEAYSKKAIGSDVNGQGSVLSPVRALTERGIVLPNGSDRETFSLSGQICEIARMSISGDLVRCGIDAGLRECLPASIPDNLIRVGRVVVAWREHGDRDGEN